MILYKPPQKLPQPLQQPSIFLAGSIEQGTAEDWQTKTEKAFKDEDCTILNPRREEWDSSWVQSINNPQFNEQVTWELDAQERANFILMYFDPKTKSPITLLELGLFAMTAGGELIVCCPEGFWRKGNVDIVCRRYSLQVAQTLDQLIKIGRYLVQNWNGERYEREREAILDRMG